MAVLKTKTCCKLAIDFGNSFINVVAESLTGVVKKSCIRSTYKELKSNKIATKNVIECGGKIVQLGVTGADSKEFTNVKKVKREHLEHQILWAAYATLGSGEHFIKLATGLPLTDYLSNAGEAEEFKERLEKNRLLEGKINGEEITLHIIDDVEVNAEGYSATTYLTSVLPHTKKTLLADVGLKTIDFALVEYNPDTNEFEPVSYDTIPQGLDKIYAPAIAELADKGVSITTSDFDNSYSRKETITVSKAEEFNPVSKVKELSSDACQEVLKLIENKIGDTSGYYKLFVGGGSKVITDVINLDELYTNVLEVEDELKYYANVLGYLQSIE